MTGLSWLRFGMVGVVRPQTIQATCCSVLGAPPSVLSSLPYPTLRVKESKMHWLTKGDPPWTDMETFHCLVCGQPYRKQPSIEPGYWSSISIQTWPPPRKTVRWAVHVFGANSGYVLCCCCSAGGSGRTEAFQTVERPTQAQRLIYPDICFWNSDQAYWNFRNWGTWAGSKS